MAPPSSSNRVAEEEEEGGVEVEEGACVSGCGWVMAEEVEGRSWWVVVPRR